MIGPRPIDTVGNSQKSGISQGCGYDESPGVGCNSRRKFLEVLFGQPAQQERPGVDARRGVALEKDLVGRLAALLAVEEVVERHFVERGGRGKGRDVPADAVALLVRADDHRHRVPADDALDAALDVAVAGIVGLFVGGDRVDVGRGGRAGKTHAAAEGLAASSRSSR